MLVFGKDVVDNHILRGLHDQLDSQSLLWEVKEKRAALRETTAQQKCLKRQKASGHTRTTLEVGDLVWVYQSQSCRKMDAPWTEPSLIVNTYLDVNMYKVKL